MSFSIQCLLIFFFSETGTWKFIKVSFSVLLADFDDASVFRRKSSNPAIFDFAIIVMFVL